MDGKIYKRNITIEMVGFNPVLDLDYDDFIDRVCEALEQDKPNGDGTDFGNTSWTIAVSGRPGDEERNGGVK